jgi:hypothetical protein
LGTIVVMAERPDTLVLLAKAPNSAIAGLWGSVLEAAGIVRHQSRGFEVFVPRSRLEEAKRLIENWKLQSDRYPAGPNEWMDNP